MGESYSSFADRMFNIKVPTQKELTQVKELTQQQLEVRGKMIAIPLQALLENDLHSESDVRSIWEQARDSLGGIFNGLNTMFHIPEGDFFERDTDLKVTAGGWQIRYFLETDTTSPNAFIVKMHISRAQQVVEN